MVRAETEAIFVGMEVGWWVEGGGYSCIQRDGEM